MRPLLAFALLLLALGDPPARAAELRGQDVAGFRSALALWLADDEETALPELAALAGAGNRAAQVLLAHVDATPPLQGPWLVALPRKQRNALLRAPGGLSGRSWMQAAAEDTPLARLWLIEHTPDVTAGTALAFAASGEHRVARSILWRLAGTHYRGFAELADEPDYPPDMRYLIWREWADDPAGRARVEAEIAALPPGDPQLAHLDLRPPDPAALDDWLATSALAAVLRVPCEAICPASVRACTRAGFELASSYSGTVAVAASGHNGLLMSGSPSETLVPAEVWNASPRGRATLLRDASLRSPEGEAIAARVGARDACFAAAITAELARFRSAAR